MNIKEFIESGIIESYVLGLAAPEEVEQVEQFSTQYPEVQRAIEEFSDLLEQQALANAIAPPAELKSKILNSFTSLQTPVSTLSVAGDSRREDHDVAPVKSLKLWRVAAAASVFALLVSAAFNVYFFNRYTTATSQYQALLIERNSLQANNNIYETKLQDWQLAGQMMANPAMAKVTLKGVPGKQDMMTTVFWDRNTKDVFLLTNKLPTPAADKQYQLWALVDGKPVDAGMLDPGCEGACKMKNIPKAQAFAITLERKGGSPTPTMDQMFVIGTI